MSDSNTHQRLRIALITALDVFDQCSWSGTFYYMTRSLQKHCGDVTVLGPMDAPLEMFAGMLITLYEGKK